MLTDYVAPVCGVGVSFLLCLLLLGLVYVVKYRRSMQRQARNSSAGHPQFDAIDSGIIINKPMGKDDPPDYESVVKISTAVVKSSSNSTIVVPPPTPDQMGTFTTHYVTGSPTSGTPPCNQMVVYVSGPLSEAY